jgi:hypothetical protein
MNTICIDCKKDLKRHHIQSTRCWKCYVKWPQIPKNNGFFVKKHNQDFKDKMSLFMSKFLKDQPSRNKKKIKIPKGKGIGYWYGKSNKDIIVKHHIDANKKNNDESNFLKIQQGKHRSLHWRGYEYLVIIDKVYDYLKEFFLKYEIVDTKINDGKVVHHVDCNRENNNSDNLLYLKDKKIHNKLHQESYKYLVRINKVNDYISWFLLREEEKLPKTETIEELK